MSTDSNSEIAALRNQVFVLLLALIVVSGTLTVYLFRQASLTGRDLSANQKLVNSFAQGQPIIAEFADRLGAYSMTHTGIRPVLGKYGIVPAPTQPKPGNTVPAAGQAPQKK